MSRVPPTLGSEGAIHPADLVELAHHHTAGRGACIIGAADSADTLDICVSEVPERFEHPGDALLGFLAPSTWFAVGLSVPIRARRLAPDETDGRDPDSGAERHRDHTQDQLTGASRLTVMVHRDGTITSLFDGPDMSPMLVAEPPEGWVPDLLRRTLGLPTASPDESLAGFVETAWLDAIASEVFLHPSSTLDWSSLAVLHPLHPLGPPLHGPLLAVETQALELESSWARMRRIWAGSAAGRSPRGRCSTGTDPRPPGQLPSPAAGGCTVGLDSWFDDGSFARWISRTLPPADHLLDVILTLLPHEVGSELVDALVSVTPTDLHLD